MKRIAILAAVAIATTAGTADAQRHHRRHGPIAEYSARLSEGDHYNSNGERLTSVAAIIRQDRANVHRFGKADSEDESDPYFASAEHRANLEAMVRRGDISPTVERAILSGEPMVHVAIYENYVTVSLD